MFLNINHNIKLTHDGVVALANALPDGGTIDLTDVPCMRESETRQAVLACMHGSRTIQVSAGSEKSPDERPIPMKAPLIKKGSYHAVL